MFDQIDMVLDLQELRELGLTADEIAGYFEFYSMTYKIKHKTKTGDPNVYEIQ